jgi:hypothetical protein
MRHQLFPLKWGNKNMVCSSPVSKTNMETSRKFAKKKKKEIRWVRVHAAKSYFPYSVWWKSRHLWWSSPPLQLSISFFNKISHFSTFQFSPWSQKKSFESGPRTWAKPFLRHDSLLSHSNGNILSFWYRNQVIQKPKFIYTSRTTTLMKESKWDKIFLHNRNW